MKYVTCKGLLNDKSGCDDSASCEWVAYATADDNAHKTTANSMTAPVITYKTHSKYRWTGSNSGKSSGFNSNVGTIQSADFANVATIEACAQKCMEESYGF